MDEIFIGGFNKTITPRIVVGNIFDINLFL